MYPFLAMAMARAREQMGQATTTDTNRVVNTYTGWTYAQAMGSSAIPPTSRLPCGLNISDMENPALCYWCGNPLESHRKEK